MEPKRKWETAAGFRVRSTLLAGRQGRGRGTSGPFRGATGVSGLGGPLNAGCQ